MAIFLVFVGGGAGAVLRYLTGVGLTRLLGMEFPYGTMAANLIGSLAMGLLVGWVLPRFPGEGARYLLAIGLLGGFTTFSSFSLDFVVLFERGEIMPALLYALVSVIGGILLLFLGLVIARSLA